MGQEGDQSALEAAKRRGTLLVEQRGLASGVTDYTAELARALADRGWRVDIATAPDHEYPDQPGVVVHGIFKYVNDASAVGQLLRRARMKKVVNGLRFLLATPKVMRLTRRAGVVHVQGWEFTPLGVIMMAAIRLAGGTVVQTPHNTFERGRSSFRRSNKALATMSACTIVHTRADVANLKQPALSRAVVIPHGEYGGLARKGGSADRSEARAELGLAEGVPTTLMFGNLREDKGVRDLVEAVRLVPDLHVLIAGKEVGGLASAADSLAAPELAGRVTIRDGFIPIDEAARLFAATDTVSLPYKLASQSGVLLLAYGFERPVIVYPIGGLAEAVEDGESGWVCDRAEIDELADKLRASAEVGWEECRRRGLVGARLAEERYSWTEIARLTENVYASVLGLAQPAPVPA
jgi:glycosyltransferase involved in cell wall biosynthesis